MEVEKLRKEPYDCENPENEDMLMKVYIILTGIYIIYVQYNGRIGIVFRSL